MLLTAVALLFAVRMLGPARLPLAVRASRRASRSAWASSVRAFSLWTFAAVVLAFAVGACVAPAARDRRRDGDRHGAVVRPPGDRVRQPGLRPAHEAGGDLGAPSGSLLRRPRPARGRHRLRSGRTSATRRSRRPTARSGATTSASGVGVASPRAFIGSAYRRCFALAGLDRPARHARGGSPARSPSRCSRDWGSARLPLLHASAIPTLRRRRAQGQLHAHDGARRWALAFGYAVDRRPARVRIATRSSSWPPRRSQASVPAVLTAVTAVLFTCAGQRVDIVGAFQPRRRHGDRSRRQPARAGALPRRRARARPADRRPGLPPGAARARRASTTCSSIVPLTDLDQRAARARRDELSARSCCSPMPEIVERLEDKYLAHVLFEERGIASPPTWLPGERARRRCVPAARQGATRLRLAAHLPRCRPRAARLLPRLHAGRARSCRRARRRGVLDRRLLRSRRPLPQRDPADDDRVEGRRVDQGHDASRTRS